MDLSTDPGAGMARREPFGRRSALWLPLFDELVPTEGVARLAAEAEEAGWHGFFVWDQLRWNAQVRQVADAWIALAAITTATERLRLGPMVTPLPRRRPVKVARDSDVGLARRRPPHPRRRDRRGQIRSRVSKTGEQLDERARGQMLDEALEILTAAWSGEPVHHHGDHYTVDDIQFLPRPVQRPDIPVWIAGFPGNVKPMRRAARYDGFFPANLEHPDQLVEVVAVVAELRDDTTAPYDIVVGLPVGVDPAPYVEAGATWWLPEFAPEELSLDGVRGLLRQGPFAP